MRWRRRLSQAVAPWSVRSSAAGLASAESAHSLAASSARRRRGLVSAAWPAAARSVGGGGGCTAGGGTVVCPPAEAESELHGHGQHQRGEKSQHVEPLKDAAAGRSAGAPGDRAR